VRAVKAALRHPKSAGLSDSEIGRHVGVDHKTVAAMRVHLGISQVKRTGKDGRTINTANIGRSKLKRRQVVDTAEPERPIVPAEPEPAPSQLEPHPLAIFDRMMAETDSEPQPPRPATPPAEPEPEAPAAAVAVEQPEPAVPAETLSLESVLGEWTQLVNELVNIDVPAALEMCDLGIREQVATHAREMSRKLEDLADQLAPVKTGVIETCHGQRRYHEREIAGVLQNWEKKTGKLATGIHIERGRKSDKVHWVVILEKRREEPTSPRPSFYSMRKRAKMLAERAAMLRQRETTDDTTAAAGDRPEQAV
jgi:hypothetical protein